MRREITELHIALQPYARIPTEYVTLAQKVIAKRFRVRVTILSDRPLPAFAYYKPRGRYRAEKLLTDLDRNTPAEYAKVMGLTTSDISTTKGEHIDWGIFGLGSLGGRPSVVSSFRPRRNASADRFRHRWTMTVLHEFGHTLGLNHCPTLHCVMEDYGGSVATVDAENGNYCAVCRARIAAFLR
jgi:archaemetzincin